MGVDNALSRLTTWTTPWPTPRAARKTQTIPVPGGRLKASPGNWPAKPAGRETPVTGSDSGYEPSRTNRGTEGPRRENRRMRPLEERALPTAAGVVPPPSPAAPVPPDDEARTKFHKGKHARRPGSDRSPEPPLPVTQETAGGTTEKTAGRPERPHKPGTGRFFQPVLTLKASLPGSQNPQASLPA